MIQTILIALKSKIGGKFVEPSLPSGRVAQLLNDDDAETLMLSDSAPSGTPTPAPIAVFIEYRDSRGASSHRRIKCKAYDVGRGTLDAYCFERRAPRRFKADRIVAVVDVQTGEVQDVTAFLAGLGGGAVSLKDERLARILTVLVFMMRCDRQVHPLEREVIEDTAASFALRFDGDDSMVDAALASAFRLAPDHDDLILALEWIGRHPDGLKLIRLLVPQIDRIVVADGQITSEEAYYGGLVMDALKAISAAALQS